MSDSPLEETRQSWNLLADDWRVQVGRDGDSNRRLNSDPVLWEFAGDVRGLAVLDAGCGTGYLSGKLRGRGARVTGVDGQFDLVIANYVLMDTPDLLATMRAFSRVLKPGGAAVLVFSHPCFPQSSATVSGNGEQVSHHWDFPYFEPRKCVDPPWGHFRTEFLWYHRPLSDYWKAFAAAGFAVVGFEEPRVTEDRYHLAENEKKLRNSKTRPYSVAFKLRKTPLTA